MNVRSSWRIGHAAIDREARLDRSGRHELQSATDQISSRRWSSFLQPSLRQQARIAVIQFGAVLDRMSINLAPTTWAWVRRIAEIAPTVLWVLAAAGAAIMIMYFPPGLLALVLEHMRRQVHRLQGQIRQLHHSGISSSSADALLDRMLDKIDQLCAASSLERDFCRRRLARQKGPEDDVSAQRPEIGDHHTREMAAKTAFLLASYQSRVSEDWVVAAPGLEPGAH